MSLNVRAPASVTLFTLLEASDVLVHVIDLQIRRSERVSVAAMAALYPNSNSYSTRGARINDANSVSRACDRLWRALSSLGRVVIVWAPAGPLRLDRMIHHGSS